MTGESRTREIMSFCRAVEMEFKPPDGRMLLKTSVFIGTYQTRMLVRFEGKLAAAQHLEVFP